MSLIWIILSIVLALPVAVPVILLAVASISEQEQRAAVISFALLPVALIPLILVLLLPEYAHWIVGLEACTLLAGMILIFGLPNRPSTMECPGPFERYDEREHMFSRADMEPDEVRYQEYYDNHPDQKDRDDRIRRQPPLTGMDSKSDFPLDTQIAEAIFSVLKKGKDLTDGEAGHEKVSLPPDRLARKLSAIAFQLGAMSCGTTELDQNHVYSHRGRTSKVSGQPVNLDHTYAFVFTVEMDWRSMQSAPRVPSIVQSSIRYWHAWAISVAIGEYLRILGYNARAHTDANYLVLLPPVAYDAGLGEIGRFGSLITPEAGTRIRLGVVTTDAQLPQQSPVNYGMADFCEYCLKCADNCPPGAISKGARHLSSGILRWHMNQEKCYSYWRKVGSDCGICMRACPYSRPGTAIHDLIRNILARSRFLRHTAARLDDLIYGRKPGPKPWPGWFG